MAAETTRAVGYIRTATTTPTDREHCTATQARQIRAYCNERSITLVGSFVDYGVAGDARERMGLGHALSILRDGSADLLVVTNVSRLARSVSSLARLTDTHFRDGTRSLVAIGECLDTRTPNGRFVLSLLDTIARWDVEVTRHV